MAASVGRSRAVPRSEPLPPYTRWGVPAVIKVLVAIHSRAVPTAEHPLHSSQSECVVRGDPLRAFGGQGGLDATRSLTNGLDNGNRRLREAL